MDEPTKLDARHQLLLDGHIIDACSRMQRRVCPLRKYEGNPVLTPEHDWEPRGYIGLGSVLYDEEDGIYKSWCKSYGPPRCWSGRTPSIHRGVHYFTSPDGIHWERPELDVVVLDGIRTNIVALDMKSDHPAAWPALHECFGVVKDVTDPDPSRRYKMGYLYTIEHYTGPRRDPNHPSEYRGLGVAFSPDGIHWQTLDGAVTYATCDGFTHWCRDVENRRWFLYGRGKRVLPEVREAFSGDPAWQKHHWGRTVTWAESEDFEHWSPNEGELVLGVDVDDGPFAEIYGMNVFPYEGIYIGLPQLFHNSCDDITLDMQLAVSRDGRQFERLSDRTPFIPVGGIGTWDRFNNSNMLGPPLRVGDELRIYYGGRNYRHPGAYEGTDDCLKLDESVACGAGFGTVKLDRFVAMEATFDAGQLRTKPLVIDGDLLHINANVAFGRLEVAVLDADGTALEGACGVVANRDDIGIPVPIPGLGALRGRPLRLLFRLYNGQLFSFWSGKAP